MVPDTAMALFELAPHDPSWFRDEAAVGRALDALLDSPLGGLVGYAGIIREAKKAPTRAAIHELVATGADDVFAVQEAKQPKRMTAVLTIALGALRVDARCYQEELARRPTVIDDLVAMGCALRDCGVFIGMRVGFVRPLLQSYASYAFERTQPRGTPRNWGLRSGAIVDLIDTRFHSSGREDADPREVRLASSDVPEWVRRTEKDGLVIARWADSISDKATLDPACEAHEDWLDSNLPSEETGPIELVLGRDVRATRR